MAEFGQSHDKVELRVISLKGSCVFGHKVGDVITFDGHKVDGEICLHTLYTVLPKVFALLYGAQFPWLENPDVEYHPCPDYKNALVFEVRRLRE